MDRIVDVRMADLPGWTLEEDVQVCRRSFHC